MLLIYHIIKQTLEPLVTYLGDSFSLRISFDDMLGWTLPSLGVLKVGVDKSFTRPVKTSTSLDITEKPRRQVKSRKKPALYFILVS